MTPAMQYKNFVTILSVFPLEQSLELKHEGIKRYVMPASPKGGFQTLRVYDTFAINRNWSVDETSFMQAPIPAGVVAENLVHSWGRSSIGSKEGFGPGIAIIAGDQPTDEELAGVLAKQEEWFRWLINQADDAEATGHRAQVISDTHRIAAEFMGVTGRAWAKKIQEVTFVQCPACNEDIRAGAVICKHCRTDIRSFLASPAVIASPVTEPAAPAAIKPKPLRVSRPEA